MTKEAEALIAPLAESVFELRRQKKELEKKLSDAEAGLKSAMSGLGDLSGVAGGYFVEIQKIAASRVVDTVALKADGLFDKYSKEKAGYDKLLVKKV